MTVELNTNVDQLVLNGFPYPIATLYKKVGEAATSSIRVPLLMRIVEHTVRALSLVVVSDYLSTKTQQVKNDSYTKFLIRTLPKPVSAGTGVELLFRGVKAFEKYPDSLFVRELLAVCNADGARDRLERLVQERNRIAHREVPTTEEDWEAKEQILLPDINALLANLEFLADYDLILITDVRDKEIDYQLWKGLKVTRNSASIKKDEDLKRLFYVTKKNRFLMLHPMIIAEEMLVKDNLLRTNLGFFENFSNQQVMYLTLPQQDEVKSNAPLNDVQAIYYRLTESQAAALNSDQLSDIVSEINRNRANKAFDEFFTPELRSLFVSRESIHQKFNDFIASEAKIFVLIGKSGIGKSSMLAELGHRYLSNPGRRMLIYDGATLTGEQSILEMLAADFKQLVKQEDNAINADNIIKILGKVHSKGEQFILVIDAINESGNADKHLKKIDDLAKFQDTDWLKIVVSSRPQAWYQLKRRVKITDRLYFIPSDATVPEIEMTEFTFDELEDAFGRYKAYYHVPTDFPALAPTIKKLLQDPFMLALTCQTYSNQAIPSHLRPSQIYSQYIERLRSDGRLSRSDIDLLQYQLMPLFIADLNDKGIQNTVTAQVLVSTSDSRGTRLSERILAEDLVDGKPINISYLNLDAAQILTLRGNVLDQKLGFRHERFWEYFGGKRLVELVHSPDSDYVKLTGIVKDKPYLRGVIRNGLLEQITNLSEEVRNPLIYTLAGNKETSQVIEDVLNIIGSEKVFDLTSLLKLMMTGQAGDADKIQSVTRKSIAISLAARHRYPDILEMAAIDPEKAIKFKVLFGMVQYWYADQQEGFAFMQRLADKAVNRFGLPVNKYFEPLMGVSIYILFREFRSQEVGEQLMKIWRPLLMRVLHFNPNPRNPVSKAYERAKGILRFQFIRIASLFVQRLAGEGSENNALSIPEINAFWAKDEKTPERMRQIAQIIHFWNIERTNIAEMEPLLKETANSPYIMIDWMTAIALDVHLRKTPEKSVEMAELLFREAAKYKPVGPQYGYGPFWIFSMATVPSYGHNATAYLDRFAENVRLMWSETSGWYQAASRKMRMLNIGSMVYYDSKEWDASLTPTVKNLLLKGMQDKDYNMLRAFLFEAGNAVLNDPKYSDIMPPRHKMAFSIFETLLGFKDPEHPDEEAKIRQLLIEKLRFYRAFFPDLVDDFLARSDVTMEFIQEVTNKGEAVNVTEMWSFQFLPFWEEAIVRTNSPDLWRRAHWLFAEVPKSPTLAAWIPKLLSGAVNLLLGATVFPGVEKSFADFMQTEYGIKDVRW